MPSEQPRGEEARANQFNNTTGGGSPLTADLFRKTVDQVGNLDARRDPAPPRAGGDDQDALIEKLERQRNRWASRCAAQEKALEAADGLSEAVSKFSILSGMFDPEISRAAYANDFYRSARATSTKEDG